jgi:hypothetical protein
MCFSAQASFTSGVVIAAIGVATVLKPVTKKERLFSFMPLFFAFQQFAEGFVWLALVNPEYDYFLFPASRYFVVMADVAWPVFVPVSVLLMEGSASKRKYLKWLLVLGVLLAGYYLFCMLTRSITPVTNSFHIDYSNDFPKFMVFPAFFVYLVVTIAPLFISSVRRMSVFGTVIFIGCFIAGIFYTQYLSSVWCFFAAIASGVIYWILSDPVRERESVLNAA